MGELKNWFDEKFYRQLAGQLHRQYSRFNREIFIAGALDGLEALSLTERLRRTTTLMAEQLPSDFVRALDILAPLAPLYEGTFKGMCFPDFVGMYGRGHFDRSLDALKYFTRYSSSEFAVREFFKLDFQRTLDAALEWSCDENRHVRRLASEGSRPRLPWSFQLHTLVQDPSPVRPVLDNLKSDTEIYVRKSVANHLNDISRDNPEIMLDWISEWDHAIPETSWISRHASRSLLKKCHPRAFALFGFTADPSLDVSPLRLSRTSLSLGEGQNMSFTVTSTGTVPQKLAIDYTVHYVKKSGKRAPKVFKLKELVLAAGATENVAKSQTFENFTTRTHYAGRHDVDILINGKVFGTGNFELRVST